MSYYFIHVLIYIFCFLYLQLIEKPIGYDDMSYLSNDRQLLQLDPMQRKTFQLFRLMEGLFNMRFEVNVRW